jgi:steroid delta-isomerase-like uncharacterized protein
MMNTCVQVILFSILLGCAERPKNANEQTAEANKKVIRHYLLDIINGRTLELLSEVFPEKFVRHDMNERTDTWMTVADQHKRLSDLLQAFPDLQYTIDDMIAEGDKVVVRTTWNGTQKNTFMKTESLGKSINGLSEIVFYRLENGKIVERWTQLDLHGLFRKMRGEN